MKYLPLRNTLQALSDLFSDMENNSEESSGEQSLSSKLLMNTVKRDISLWGHLLSCLSFPFCSSHLFQWVSLTGSIHQCQRTIREEEEVDRYIVIHPRNNSFWIQNYWSSFVAISRANSAGKIILIPTLHYIPPSWQMQTVYATK